MELAILRLMDCHRPNSTAPNPAMRSRPLVDAARLATDLFSCERRPSGEALLPLDPMAKSLPWPTDITE